MIVIVYDLMIDRSLADNKYWLINNYLDFVQLQKVGVAKSMMFVDICLEVKLK